MRFAVLASIAVSVPAVCFVALAKDTPHSVPQPSDIPNQAIDFRGFLVVAREVASYRENRRVSEEVFLEMSREEGTIVLDTRSAAKFAELHIQGARHLNFSDITKESLAEAIPEKDTRILIYCNNNFRGRPVEFAAKMPPAALNIPTFVTLYEYGYRNIYELGPVIDADKSELPLVSSAEEAERALESAAAVPKAAD